VVNFAVDATAPSELWNIEALDMEGPARTEGR
jgi:hypothetical protein